MVDIDDRKTNKKAIGSFQYGGVVDETGAYNLHKGELVVNPYERFPSLAPGSQPNPYKPMDQASFQQLQQGVGQSVTQGFAPELGEESLEETQALMESRDAASAARRAARQKRREERQLDREEARQRKQNELSTRAGVAGGGSFFAGSQIIPYASTAARLKALQGTGLSSRDAALFDQAERERSMAGQQRFVRRGGKRRAYG